MTAGIRVRIHSDVDFAVWHLLDGLIRHPLVGLKSVDDGSGNFGGDVHAVSICLPSCAGNSPSFLSARMILRSEAIPSRFELPSRRMSEGQIRRQGASGGVTGP